MSTAHSKAPSTIGERDSSVRSGTKSVGGRLHNMSTISSSIKYSASAFRPRGSKLQTGSATPAVQPQRPQVDPSTVTILQRRDRLRVLEEGADITPRNLTHPLYPSVEDRHTAFDQVCLAQLLGFRSSGPQLPRQSLSATSFSTLFTVDDIESLASKQSLKGSPKDATATGPAEDDDAPSQYRLPRLESRENFNLYDKVTIVLRETETFFLFELPQLTEDASTEAGQAVIEENEKYRLIMKGAGRKTVSAETQTPEIYTKTRGTYIGRKETKNSGTIVNNWVMHDTYNEKPKIVSKLDQVNRFKLSDDKQSEHQLQPEEQLAAIAKTDAYEDAARVTLRILASKLYEGAQKKFAGLHRQDPCDRSLKLVYGLEPLWRHENEDTSDRPVSTFKWNPINASLVAVGYGAVVSQPNAVEESPRSQYEGLLLVWCAKNPNEPDRSYEFNSPVSDLDWSRCRPSLLAVGFYDGIVRIIDASKRQLTVLKETNRKTSPSYEPHWQVQWWTVFNEAQASREEIYSSNQDGRVCFYPATEAFVAHKILQLQRVEGNISGVRRLNRCLIDAIPIDRSPGALLLCRHPKLSGIYLVGTEEGCVLRCSTVQPLQHLHSFLAHDGPIYSLEYSPFCSKLLLSCGADWSIRIWAEGIDEPLLTFGTRMASVNAAAWSPRNSTIFASAVGNEICVWDIRRKTYRPASVTQVCEGNARLQCLQFTRSGEQIIAGDNEGTVYVLGLTGIPFPPFDQTETLVDALHKTLLTKPEVIRRLAKIGPPFDVLGPDYVLFWQTKITQVQPNELLH